MHAKLMEMRVHIHTEKHCFIIDFVLLKMFGIGAVSDKASRITTNKTRTR